MKSHWYDRQLKDDAKVVKRLTAIKLAFRRLLDSRDTECMEGDDLHELLAMETKLSAMLGKYERPK